MCAAPAHEPLALIRRLYDAWNAGDVATAADLLSPDVQWESFGGERAAGPHAMQATLAGGSGGTWQLTAVAIDLLVGVLDHVIAFSRRRGAEPERLEIWTLRDGRAVHYRGYPLDDGLAVVSTTTRSGKLESVCRAVLAFNRGDRAGWADFFEGEGREFAERLSGQRLDDVKVLGETFEALVVSATYHHGESSTAPVNLVITFADAKARRVIVGATPEAALAAAADPVG
jgi:SnoaL-like protein